MSGKSGIWGWWAAFLGTIVLVSSCARQEQESKPQGAPSQPAVKAGPTVLEAQQPVPTEVDHGRERRGGAAVQVPRREV